MNIFGKKDQQQSNEQWVAIKATLDETETRLNSFLQKLTERSNELLEGFKLEAKSLKQNEDDIHEQAYHRFSSGIKGQLTLIRKKVDEVRENQVLKAYRQYEDVYESGSKESKYIDKWSERCCDTINAWEDSQRAEEDNVIKEVEKTDYEIVFQKLIDSYNLEKEKVHCKQCGSKLNIDKLYYYSAYITCAYCKTQNVFDPGTSARLIEDTARKLGEQRANYLSEQSGEMQQKERDLYMQGHELKLSLIHEKDQRVIAEKQLMIKDLEEQRRACEKESPLLMEKYYKTVFDEITKLLPDLKEHNEKFYESIINKTNLYKH